MESTDYETFQLTEEVGPDLVTCNSLTTLTMYDPIAEFTHLFPQQKPTELLPL